MDNTAPTISIGAPSASYRGRRARHLHGDLRRRELQFQQPGRGQHHPERDGHGQRHGRSVTGSGLTYTVTISSITGNGTLGISIAAGTASDLAGNLAPAAGPSATFMVDNTAPTISIGAPSASYAAGGPVTYTVTYADANFNSSTLAAGQHHPERDGDGQRHGQPSPARA